MRYILLPVLAFWVLLCFENNLYAQTAAVPGAAAAAHAVINFSQMANYYAHPSPSAPRLLPEPDDDGRPANTSPLPAGQIHRRPLSPAMLRPASPLPLLPVSPAPADSFRSTLSDSTAIPPDTHGAANSAYLVTAINSAVHIQNRSGGNISLVSLDQFWNSVLPTGTTGSFDPRVVYDPYTSRWIMVALCDGQNSNSSLLVAASGTSNPTGTWYLFRIRIDGTGHDWLDFPTLGFNNKWIVVGGNLFTNTGGTFVGARVYCFNKANVLSNTNSNNTIINQNTSFTICPAYMYDSLEPNLFGVESWDGTSGVLQLWKITGNVGSEVMTSLGYPASTTNWWNTSYTVSGTQGADFAPQTGSTHKIQTNDDRINNFVYRNGKLWCAQNVFLPYNAAANATRSSVQWWEIDTTGTPVQIGLQDDPTNANFYAFGSITVNANNDALLGFSHFSSSIHPSACYALHMHTDPSDSMRPYHTFRPGQNTYYLTYGGANNRWGDYSATMIDPVNNIDFWTIQEASGSPLNTWDTWWANVQLCNTPSAPTSITQPSVPPCPGATATYSTPTITGASAYTWSVSGTGWSGSSTSNSINLYAGTGVATISVAAVASCGSSSTAYTITVTPSSVPASPSGVVMPVPPCAGSTAVYKVPAVSGATSYTWTVSGTGWSGSATTASDSISLTAGSVTGSVSVTANNTCGSSSAYVFSAPVSSRPSAPGSANLPAVPCAGSSATYSVPAVAGASSYTWSVSGTGWSGSATTSADSVHLTAGSVSGSVSVTANNACGSSTAYIFSAPVNNPPAAPTSVNLPATAPCNGVVATYSVPSVSGATSYTWSLSGTGWSGSSSSNSINLTAGTGAATVSVTANNACGSSAPYVFTAPHGTVPAAPASVTLPATPCQGNVATYLASAVSGATSYTWSFSGTGWSGSSSTDSIRLTAGSSAASVSVTANNACGSSTAYVFSAAVNTPPAVPGPVTLPSTPCAGTTAVYTVPTVSGATSYTWSLSGTGWSGSSSSNSITLTTGSSAATVSVTANNACGSSTAYMFSAPVNNPPVAPASVNRPAAHCAGTTASYSVPSVSGASSYTWSVSGSGWSGTSTSNSINITAGTGTGTVSVTANNSCGSSAPFVFSITPGIAPVTAPVVITPSPAPCSGSIAICHTNPVAGATSYLWQELGSGWSGTSSTDSISLTTGSVAGTIICTAVNACGNSPADSVHITPAPMPAAAVTIDTPLSPLCSGSTGLFYTPAITNATLYQWTVSGTGWSGVSTSDSIYVTAGSGPGTLRVEGQNACGTGLPYSLANISVVPSPVASFSLSSHITSIGHAVTITFTGTTAGPAVYNWNFGGGTAVPDSGQGPISISWNATGMMYIHLTLNYEGCQSQYTDSVQVNKNTAIQEIMLSEMNIEVIPNPNNGSFLLRFSEVPTKPFKVELSDATGRLVYSRVFDAYTPAASVETSNLPAGIYLATVSSNGQSVNRKVIVSK